MNELTEYPYLAHHGILGQKWGVRRFQNEDGSYTKRGLARYSKASENYNSSKENYNNAKNAYKNGSGSKDELLKSKRQFKKSKKELNASYEKLKSDNMADKGKRLAAEGKTITGNSFRKNIEVTAITVAGIAVAEVARRKLDSRNLHFVTSKGNIPVSAIAVPATRVAASAIATGFAMHREQQNKYIRSYYNH